MGLEVGITVRGPFQQAHRWPWERRELATAFHDYLAQRLPPNAWDCGVTLNDWDCEPASPDPEKNWLLGFTVRLWDQGRRLEAQNVSPSTVLGLVATFVMETFEAEEQVNATLTFM